MCVFVFDIVFYIVHTIGCNSTSATVFLFVYALNDKLIQFINSRVTVKKAESFKMIAIIIVKYSDYLTYLSKSPLNSEGYVCQDHSEK